MRPLTVVGATLLAALAALPAAAQTELKIMAPAAPGGGWDQTARAMQQALVSSGFAKSVQVVNVPGAGGSVGLAQLINSGKGDGRQLMVNGFVMVGALLTNKSAVRLDQATPIAKLTEEVEVIVVPASSPIKNAQDLAAAVKADPAKVTWAGGSAGGVDHITAAMFAQAVGADATKINYIPFSGGGESLAAILGARVTAGISGYGEYEGQIKAGRLRLIGVTAAKRVDGIDGPTFREQGIDLVIANWRSVMAPPGLSAQQRDELISLVEKMAKSPAWKQALKQKGWDDALLTGDAFESFLKSENARVAGVLKSVGLIAALPAGVSAPAPGAPPVAAKQAAPSSPPIASAAPHVVAPPPAIPALPQSVAPSPELGRRVALIVGNSAYKGVPKLTNPRNDAEAVASALRRVGFETVSLQFDLGKETLVGALRSFAREAEKADWALVYFAGHGIEMGGINYLVPVDAKLETDRDVDFEAVPLSLVTSAVEGAKRMRLVLLDACRDNPFARQMKRNVASRSIGRGFGSIEPEAGTLVVYAAKHGEIALDGEGKNSPFVTAFIKNLTTPGIEIRKMFDLVRDDVMEMTNRRQQPFSYGSVSGRQDFYFVQR